MQANGGDLYDEELEKIKCALSAIGSTTRSLMVHVGEIAGATKTSPP